MLSASGESLITQPDNHRQTPPLNQVMVSHLVGGAAIIAIRLSKAARQRGYECVAWVPGVGPATQSLDLAKVPHRLYNLSGLKGGQLRRLGACGSLACRMLDHRRPIVHVHDPVVFGLMRPGLRSIRARTVVHFHIEPTHEEIEWTLKQPPDQIIACARYIADAVKQRANPENVRISAVPNAVDLEKFVPGEKHAARERLGLPTSQFVTLMLANLAPHKGQVTALKALRLLVDKGLPVECWLAGEDREAAGRHERSLRELASSLGLTDRTRFLGFQKHPETLLQAADAFLLPSTREGLPLSVLEAQACRVPVVASDIPGVREVVDDGETGFVVAAPDYNGYANRLAELIENPAMNQAIVNAAYDQVVSEHSVTAYETRVFEIYQAVARGLAEV